MGRFLQRTFRLLVLAERIRLVLLIVVLLGTPVVFEVLDHMFLSMRRLLSDEEWLSLILSFSLPISTLSAGALFLNQMRRSEWWVLATALVGSLVLWGLYWSSKLTQAFAESRVPIVIQVLGLSILFTAITVGLLRRYVRWIDDAIQGGRCKNSVQWFGAAIAMVVAFSANWMFNSSDGEWMGRFPLVG